MESNFIGFANLAEQVHRKSVKRGFEFTLMVVGESGLGKSTLVNSLFHSDLLQTDKVLPPVDQNRTINIQKTTMEIEEKGVKLRLTIVDTPGFGDGLNAEDSWKACSKYVDDQFSNYYEGESGLNRKHIVDTRVHCCLYFIPPYGHGLRSLDLEFLKRLQYKVNLIPVIAKADCLTPSEVERMKAQINREIEENDIEIYQFPDCESDEDDDFKSNNEKLKSSLPFAISSGTNFLEIAGTNKKVRGRQYPWGVVEVENPDHSDYALLRRFLIQTHMQDLKDVTHDVHYENYRVQCLSGSSRPPPPVAERGRVVRNGNSDGSNGTSEKEKERLLQEKDREILMMQQKLKMMEAKLANSGGH